MSAEAVTGAVAAEAVAEAATPVREPRKLRTFNGNPMPDPFSRVAYGDTPMPEVPNGWVDAQLAAGKLVVVD
jgi:hypothetical protein